MSSSTSTKKGKLQNKLNEFSKELITLDKTLPNNVAEMRQLVFERASEALQAHKLYELIKYEADLGKKKDNPNIDLESLTIIDYSIKILRLAQEKRTESYKTHDVQVSKNVIDHGAVLFVSGSSSRTKKSSTNKNQGIVLEKSDNGKKILTYENSSGRLVTLFDTRVFLGLHKIWELRGKQKKVTFTLHELCETVNIGTTGKDYANVKESLSVLYDTSVVMRNYYIKNKNQRIETTKFHLIQGENKVELKSGENVYAVEQTIVFSDYLQLSLMEGYVSFISLALLEDLQSATAQAIYLKLCGESLNDAGRYEFNVDQLAEIIGLSSNNTKSRNRQLIKQALAELETIKILKSFYFPPRTDKFIMYPSDWFATIARKEEANTLTDVDEIPRLIEGILSRSIIQN
ncbi:Replication protein [Brevibacillus sp. IT-7CA2]|uniref:replication initiator protein A n=1 Tax=Brevibacillus sp. IT-7CA2 TaxID=3026436 RepID=UPI0039E0DF0C